jgi:imidazolonepropionase-like amidohydrolase
MLASFNGVLDTEELKADPAVALLPAKWREALLTRAHAAGWPRAAAAARAAAARARMVKALTAAGARLATGVDTGSAGFNVPGAGVHRELALLVKAGLAPADAIRAATVNCAEMLGVAANLGQVKAGFRADLFAVDGDPLANVADLRRVRIVVRGGEALNPGELLAQARRAAR